MSDDVVRRETGTQTVFHVTHPNGLQQHLCPRHVSLLREHQDAGNAIGYGSGLMDEGQAAKDPHISDATTGTCDECKQHQNMVLNYDQQQARDSQRTDSTRPDSLSPMHPSPQRFHRKMGPFEPLRQSLNAKDDPCTACSGTGEQGTGHECYICDGSGSGAEERESRAQGITNNNPGNGLPVGRDDAQGIKPVTAAIKLQCGDCGQEYFTDGEPHGCKIAKKDDRFEGVSLKQDDDGWYVSTHRARSDSYESPEKIPQKDVDFIESTGARTARVRTAPGPNGDDTDPDPGIMIAVVPPRRVVRGLPLPEGGEHPDNVHVTLAYLGKTSDHTPEQMDSLPELIAAWAETEPSLKARVQGTGTFVNEGNHVLWASVDVPGIAQMHVRLVDYLTSHGFTVADNHGFVPHMTLSYEKHHVRFLPKIVPTEFAVREVWCCIGERWESFRLTGK